jgi:hypothetical protein
MSPPEPHKPTADETQVSADARFGPCALPLASEEEHYQPALLSWRLVGEPGMTR